MLRYRRWTPCTHRTRTCALRTTWILRFLGCRTSASRCQISGCRTRACRMLCATFLGVRIADTRTNAMCSNRSLLFWACRRHAVLQVDACTRDACSIQCLSLDRRTHLRNKRGSCTIWSRPSFLPYTPAYQIHTHNHVSRNIRHFHLFVWCIRYTHVRRSNASRTCTASRSTFRPRRPCTRGSCRIARLTLHQARIRPCRSSARRKILILTCIRFGSPLRSTCVSCSGFLLRHAHGRNRLQNRRVLCIRMMLARTAPRSIGRPLGSCTRACCSIRLRCRRDSDTWCWRTRVLCSTRISPCGCSRTARPFRAIPPVPCSHDSYSCRLCRTFLDCIRTSRTRAPHSIPCR